MQTEALRLNRTRPRFITGISARPSMKRRYDEAGETLLHESTHRTGSQRILAPALVQHGRIDEAKVVIRQFVLAHPSSTTEHWAATQHSSREIDCEHFMEDCLTAGIP
jgi:hypothetical protein